MGLVAVGLGVRDEYLDELVSLRDRSVLDVLEVMVDDGLVDGPRRAAWRRLGTRWPLIAHGTELGIADAQGVDPDYVARVGRALGELHVRWYSEHLSFLHAGDLSLGHFAPPSADPMMASVLRDNAALVRSTCHCPLLLENPADVLGWERAAGGRALGERFNHLVAAAGAGILLDLTNLVLSARNDGYCPDEFFGALDPTRVVEVHLAGGHHDGSLWIDSHAHPIDEEAFASLVRILPRLPNLRAVVVERDDRLPPLPQLLDELTRVRRALAAAGRA